MHENGWRHVQSHEGDLHRLPPSGKPVDDGRGSLTTLAAQAGRSRLCHVISGSNSNRLALERAFVLDGPINRHTFEAYVEKVLMPQLRSGEVVIMDNLSSHKGPKVRKIIEATGASLLCLLYLPRYSLDFNPIENAVSKL